jgi:extracellular elastinolytic metalloproteinase
MVPSEDVLHPHAEYCQSINSQYSRMINFGGNGAQTPLHPESASLLHLLSTHCAFDALPEQFAKDYPSTDFGDLRPALLQFMIAATPREGLAEEMIGNHQHYIDGMSVMMGGPFAPSDEHATVLVDNVPDAVGPVKSKLVYNQVVSKDGKSTQLALSWKVSSLDLLDLSPLAN